MRSKQHHFLFWILTFFLVSIQLSCTLDSEAKTKSKKVDLHKHLVGNWIITAAEKNGRPTGMLEGAYFKFQSGNKMSTNLTGSEISYDYVVKKDEIHQIGNIEIFYKVLSIQDTTMVLTFDMRGFPFKLNLTKS